ncbi:hypothetical protein Riv7116_6602 [Rivularia sp. PCC 7116]|uniref:hypothetical protein n=1 Tax=Rivularia sp. PCC 7116 TaxID=373994 RepID=UPI00029EDDD6|nr:hypothetical protein [Rivularia sp. PCC 7116]AFY58929.1 hypothetical protein Riv7116_6602 [Rivularia sp. PCC 7116]
MDIKNSFDITVSESLIQRLEKVKETATQNLNNFTDKAQQVSENWKQTATQNTEDAINKFNNTIEQTKGSLQENLPQVSVQTVVTSSVADWFEQHPAFLRVLNCLNWAVNHPIISLIIFVFSLAILWNLVKFIGSLIEKASLSILKIPFKLLGALIKSFWLWLVKLSNFATDKVKQTKTVTYNSELQLNHNTPYQIISSKQQKRLKDISARLEEIQLEQQELLKEAAEILDGDKINNSVN